MPAAAPAEPPSSCRGTGSARDWPSGPWGLDRKAPSPVKRGAEWALAPLSVTRALCGSAAAAIAPPVPPSPSAARALCGSAAAAASTSTTAPLSMRGVPVVRAVCGMPRAAAMADERAVRGRPPARRCSEGSSRRCGFLSGLALSLSPPTVKPAPRAAAAAARAPCASRGCPSRARARAAQLRGRPGCPRVPAAVEQWSMGGVRGSEGRPRATLSAHTYPAPPPPPHGDVIRVVGPLLVRVPYPSSSSLPMRRSDEARRRRHPVDGGCRLAAGAVWKQ